MSKHPTSPHKPHDQFFKLIFSDKDNVISFLRGTLPENLFNILDLTSLKLDNNSYLSPELKESFADVVYRAKADNRKISLAFLFEHKSYVEEQPYLQLLTYMMGIWQQEWKNKEQKLSVVVPMVIFHGEGRWQHRSFYSFFEAGEMDLLRPYIPDFSYWLTNLQRQQDEEIKSKYQEFILQKGFLFMKHIRDEDLLHKLDDLFAGFEKLVGQQNKHIYFRSFYVYLASGNDKNKERIMKKTENILENWGFVEGSMAHEWFLQGEKRGLEKGKKLGLEKGKKLGLEKGLEKGLAQGLEKGLIQSIKKLLLNGLPAEQIVRILEVSEKMVFNIAKDLENGENLKR